MRKKTKIVGLKYRGISQNFVKNLIGSEVSFILEPENKYDRFAIKCVANGLHFGYVSKNDSTVFTGLIKIARKITIEITSFDEYKIDIEALFDIPDHENKDVKNQFIELQNGNTAGIYEISFFSTITHETKCYIGQSNNINRRLKTHDPELGHDRHHNLALQEAWNLNSQSFRHRILQICPLNIDEFEKQIWLFRKETEHIKLSEITTVNKIDADLVLTNNARSKLSAIVKATISALRENRKNAILVKESIGQEVIDCGILKEEKFWDGWQRGGSREKKYLSIKASNVLTWLNKSRYGMLEYRPKIDFSHPRYKVLKEELNFAHKKVKNLDRNVKKVKEFLYAIENKDRYETCKIEFLEEFLFIVESVFNKKSEIPKKIINCPNCNTKIRIPSDMRVKFTCPSCKKKYVTK